MALLVPIPYLAMSPGPVFNVLGDYEGKKVLTVTGAETFPTSGELDMTTVSEAGGAGSPVHVSDAIAALIDPHTTVIPRDQRYPEGPPADQQVDQKVFEASESNAVGAAAKYLGRPVKTTPMVFSVVPGGPADGKLESGDEIVAVDGRAVSGAADVRAAVSTAQVGQTVTLDVIREGQPVSVPVQTGPAPDDPNRAVVGILVDNQYSSDFQLAIGLEGIGGPSAGLVLAMGTVDQLTPEHLIDGRHVAVTGTIDGEGTVGPIGGIDKKMVAARAAGAELFLAPSGNCDEVVTSTPEGLSVARVNSLTEAIDVVKAWREGGRIPTCPGAGLNAQGGLG
jgi:PDZ domain-containing protein